MKVISEKGELKFMVILSKIFLMSNTIKILPFLIEQGRIGVWVNFFVSVLSNQLDGSNQLVQKTEVVDHIE
jgi:hypothetical protein